MLLSLSFLHCKMGVRQSQPVKVARRWHLAQGKRVNGGGAYMALLGVGVGVGVCGVPSPGV